MKESKVIRMLFETCYDLNLDFVNTTINKEAERIQAYPELTNLVTSTAALTNDTRKNEWIPDSAIRSSFDADPSKKLEEALKAHILIKNGIYYKFRNQITYTAVFRTPE